MANQTIRISLRAYDHILLDKLNSTPKTVESLMKLDLPAGVDIEIKV